MILKILMSNYAEWYSLVGCYNKGNIGKVNESSKGTGLKKSSDSTFDNQRIFTQIAQKIISADEIVCIIDKYNVITYNDLYSALITDYPNSKTVINSLFKNYYVQKGSREGNVINYK